MVPVVRSVTRTPCAVMKSSTLGAFHPCIRRCAWSASTSRVAPFPVYLGWSRRSKWPRI